MDATSKANFINQIANGAEVVCDSCGARNKANNKFCEICGKEIISAVEKGSKTAFAPITESPATESTEPQPKKAQEPEQDTNSSNVFAQGLPSWDIVPPQVMVRRR